MPLSPIYFLTLLLPHTTATLSPPHHNLLPRETNTTLIDPVTQPFCEISSCWHWSAPPPTLCPLIPGPCPNTSAASDNGGRTCGINQYSQSCYCSLKTPLSCAFSCSWDVWWETEDWFSSLCPNSPGSKKIDFSPLPKCARDCLDDAVFGYGCLTQTSNCFCSKGDLFGCHENCHSDQDYATIEKWIVDVCGVDEGTATEALKSGTFVLSTASATAVGGSGGEGNGTKVSAPPAGKGKGLSWDEGFILGVLGVSILVGMGLFGQGLWVRKKFDNSRFRGRKSE